MTDHKPLFRKIIDAIHALQGRTMTITERAAAADRPSWPDCVSNTPRFGTAVSPYHAVFAAHYPLSPGMTLRFGDEERTIDYTITIGGDLGVASWRRPIAAEPMLMLPWDWRTFLPTRREVGGHLREPIVAWRCNQDGNVWRTPVWKIDEGGVGIDDAEGTVLAGDSGGPIWLALEKPVLLGLMSSGSGGSCLQCNFRPLMDATDWRVREPNWRLTCV